jgi:hypothetical protein
MTFQVHPEFKIHQLKIGREQAPLLVVDNLAANADQLVEHAASKVFTNVPGYFPGIRAKVPLTYQQFVIDTLRDAIAETFGVTARTLHFTSCHFSLVTTRGDKLAPLQRIPHVDSMFSSELALMHYLFKSDLGGTAFYRHRSTGFEYVNVERNDEYCRCVSAEMRGPDGPRSGYISSTTPLFEQIGAQDGQFNRLLVYRRNSLHSSNLTPRFVPDASPRSGRLSINGFLK